MSNGINTLFKTKGLGAKTSSGFGVVKEDISDIIFDINVKDKTEINKKEVEKTKYLKDLYEKIVDIAEIIKKEGCEDNE